MGRAHNSSTAVVVIRGDNCCHTGWLLKQYCSPPRPCRQGAYRKNAFNSVALVCPVVGVCRIPFPIKLFSPSGYIDTLYLDDDLRISKGDKGSIFVARRADQQ